jgi:hypothetical protein
MTRSKVDDIESLDELDDIERRNTTWVRLIVDGVIVAEGCRPLSEMEAYERMQRALYGLVRNCGKTRPVG